MGRYIHLSAIRKVVLVEFRKPYYCISRRLATAINSPSGRFDRLPEAVGKSVSRCSGDGTIDSGKQEKLRRKDEERNTGSGVRLDHPDTFTIGADPGGAVAYPPLVFLKTVIADLKSAGTAPAEWLFFFAAVAAEFTELSLAVSGASCFLVVHGRNSAFIQSMYSRLPATMATAMISGVS
jgi:hypothetical protein